MATGSGKVWGAKLSSSPKVQRKIKIKIKMFYFCTIIYSPISVPLYTILYHYISPKVQRKRVKSKVALLKVGNKLWIQRNHHFSGNLFAGF